jgi:hypothetical protein
MAAAAPIKASPEMPASNSVFSAIGVSFVDVGQLFKDVARK